MEFLRRIERGGVYIGVGANVMEDVEVLCLVKECRVIGEWGLSFTRDFDGCYGSVHEEG